MMRLFILLVMMFCAVAVVAQEADGGVYGLVSAQQLEVHIGPDFAYDTIDVLPHFASLAVSQRSTDNQWLRVTYDTGSGWVYAKYVRLSANIYVLPNTAQSLPRNRNGRVPDEFSLATPVCDQWQGAFTLEGDVNSAENTILTATVPPLQGANWYRVYVFAPDSSLRLSDGVYVQADSQTNVVQIETDKLPHRSGIFTWMAAPYWTSDATGGYYGYRQQVCPLRVGGMFERNVSE